MLHRVLRKTPKTNFESPIIFGGILDPSFWNMADRSALWKSHIDRIFDRKQSIANITKIYNDVSRKIRKIIEGLKYNYLMNKVVVFTSLDFDGYMLTLIIYNTYNIKGRKKNQPFVLVHELSVITVGLDYGFL